MDSIGCGCKICKAGLGDNINEMIQGQIEPIAVLRFLYSKDCEVTDKLLRKHLSAFSIEYPEKETAAANKGELEPISNNISEIDFTQKIDLDNLELLQKITLKMFLNQSRITLKAQQKMIDGVVPDMPRDTLENMTLALDMLEKTTALSNMVSYEYSQKPHVLKVRNETREKMEKRIGNI